MTAMKIIDTIQKNAKVNLSIRERNWIKDNSVKLQLYVKLDDFFITLDEFNPKIHTIIQNGKKRTIAKLDSNNYAIIVSMSGCCRILLPQQ